MSSSSNDNRRNGPEKRAELPKSYQITEENLHASSNHHAPPRQKSHEKSREPQQHSSRREEFDKNNKKAPILNAGHLKAGSLGAAVAECAPKKTKKREQHSGSSRSSASSSSSRSRSVSSKSSASNSSEKNSRPTKNSHPTNVRSAITAAVKPQEKNYGPSVMPKPSHFNDEDFRRNGAMNNKRSLSREEDDNEDDRRKQKRYNNNTPPEIERNSHHQAASSASRPSQHVDERITNPPPNRPNDNRINDLIYQAEVQKFERNRSYPNKRDGFFGAGFYPGLFNTFARPSDRPLRRVVPGTELSKKERQENREKIRRQREEANREREETRQAFAKSVKEKTDDRERRKSPPKLPHSDTQRSESRPIKKERNDNARPETDRDLARSAATTTSAKPACLVVDKDVNKQQHDSSTVAPPSVWQKAGKSIQKVPVSVAPIAMVEPKVEIVEKQKSVEVEKKTSVASEIGDVEDGEVSD